MTAGIAAISDADVVIGRAMGTTHYDAADTGKRLAEAHEERVLSAPSR